MSKFSGLSAILTVSLVALITVQMLKDKFDVIENFGESDENGNPYTIRDTSTAQNVSEERLNIPVYSRDLNDVSKHGKTPFIAGNFFFTTLCFSKC